MSNIGRAFGLAVLTMAGLGLQAEDFTPIMQVVKTVWPDKNHIGVICDYNQSRAEVEALSRAAGDGFTITVVDVRLPEKAALGARLVANHQAQFLVIFPKDRSVRDGSLGATVAILSLANRGIPSVGTTPRSVAQGAVFSIGDGTGGELLVTPETIGTVEVVLPPGVTYSRKAKQPSLAKEE